MSDTAEKRYQMHRPTSPLERCPKHAAYLMVLMEYPQQVVKNGQEAEEGVVTIYECPAGCNLILTSDKES